MSSEKNKSLEIQALKPRSIGLIAVLFMVLATAAPITAMTGNVPVAIGYGNGIGAPAGFLIAMIMLLLFSIGFVAMTRYITTTSAFYGFISHGLGRWFGMASGFLSVMAYVVFEAALVGIFSSFAETTVKAQFGVDISWVVYALLMIVLNAVLSYYNINLAAKVLSVFLVLELLILAIMACGVFFHGGGPDGIPLSPINPVNAFKGVSPAVGIVFAFWSWVGFESTAIYGEESYNPKKVIPLATYIAVIGVGVFYIIVSWAIVAGNGLHQSVVLAQKDPFALLFNPTRLFVGQWAVDVWQWLLITGSFACGLAFHNCASRYLYSLGRERVLGASLGRTHVKHGSPFVASFSQSAITFIIVGLFALCKQDPYVSLYTMAAILGTLAVLLVQALCSFSVIVYFARKRRDGWHWFKTGVAPFLGGLGMLLILFLLVENLGTAGGSISSLLIFKLLPWIVIVVFILGLVLAAYLKKYRPEKYARLGRIVFEDGLEKPIVDTDSDTLQGKGRTTVEFD